MFSGPCTTGIQEVVIGRNKEPWLSYVSFQSYCSPQQVFFILVCRVHVLVIFFPGRISLYVEALFLLPNSFSMGWMHFIVLLILFIFLHGFGGIWWGQFSVVWMLFQLPTLNCFQCTKHHLYLKWSLLCCKHSDVGVCLEKVLPLWIMPLIF